MANMKSTASAAWEGSLTAGSGMVEFNSGAFENAPVSWASRTESANGKTSPEELVAAAHASCYAMAFSNVLNLGQAKASGRRDGMAMGKSWASGAHC